MTKNIVGLTKDEVLRSKEKHGTNVLAKEKTKGFFRKFLENLNDPIIKILIIALGVEVVFTFGHTNLFEVFGIILAILIATTVSTASEFGSERAFKRMQSESESTRVRVLRGGSVDEISADELVVGDVVYISAGEKIAADGVLLSGRCSVDQSALNGESREVAKSPTADDSGWELSSPSRIFCGTLVATGTGVMRVERVGASTYYGMVAKDVQSETRESPLKLRLSRLASQISKIGYVMALLVATIYLFNVIVVENDFDPQLIWAAFKDFRGLFADLMHALTLMITVIVVAVPEGLPMMITVVLSANMKKMFADNVLVKKLVGIETAGSMNILFTDKTGTITVGEPRLERIETADSTYKSISSLKSADEIYRVLLISAMYNTDTYVSSCKIVGGNGTDRAIAEFFKSDHHASMKVISKESFSSEKKYSTVTLSNGTTYIKGAPEIIIAKSKCCIDSNGKISAIDSVGLQEKLHQATSRGNRVVAVAYKDESADFFVFTALIVLKDMLRRDSRTAIQEIRGAGVQIVMLTGDAAETATAIAEECGIIRAHEHGVVITSQELARMSDDEVKELMPTLRVVARALPQDKTRLVRLAQELGLVVGMTGDGINDAPSLKLSDVGFAMGNGADIAKSAGDVVIINNSMMAISKTILYGRTIFKSIRKFITFQLVMNLAACGVSIFGQLLGIESPITIIQMLWVNIIMDTLGGLAFAGEPALAYYMKERPKRRDEPILSRDMLTRILVMGVFSLGVCIAFLELDVFRSMFVGEDSERRFLTAFYALFIFLGIVNCFCARCERMWILSNISKNKPFVIIMMLITVIQILMIFYGGDLFRSSPLSIQQIAMTVFLALSLLPFDMAVRVYRRLSAPKK